MRTKHAVQHPGINHWRLSSLLFSEQIAFENVGCQVARLSRDCQAASGLSEGCIIHLYWLPRPKNEFVYRTTDCDSDAKSYCAKTNELSPPPESTSFLSAPLPPRPRRVLLLLIKVTSALFRVWWGSVVPYKNHMINVFS